MYKTTVPKQWKKWCYLKVPCFATTRWLEVSNMARSWNSATSPSSSQSNSGEEREDISAVYCNQASSSCDTVDGQNIQTLRKRSDWHPRPQMSKLNNVCVTCHAAGFDFFCPPVSTLGRKNNFEIGGARGIKLSRVWIFCPSTVCLSLNRNIRYAYAVISYAVLSYMQLLYYRSYRIL